MASSRPGSKDVQMDDLGDEAHDRDPESLKPFTRGNSLYRRWTGLTDHTGSHYGAPSIKSVASHWSVQWIVRWSPGSKRTATLQPQPETILTDSQTQFLTSILGEAPILESPMQEACAWYIGFLEFKIREAWTTLFRAVLIYADPSTNEPSDPELSVAFDVLKSIVKESSERESLVLINLVDSLYNEKKLRYTDRERSLANQLAFAAFGWISGLYPAKLNPSSSRLQIINPWEGSSARDARSMRQATPRRRMKTFTNYDQSLDLNDQSFHTLLSGFGNVVPQRARSMIPGQSTPLQILPTRRDEHSIETSLLCFRTLNKVVSLKIEWVDSLSLHLEFNNSTKTLKLFRLPSLCLVMCSCKRSPLSRLFSDADKSSRYFMEAVEDNIDPRDFYREILLSYRLIFGQDKNSHNDFNAWIEKGKPLPEEYHDSLLPILCGQSWDSADALPIYEFIDADDPSTHYSPTEDFPFLGKRLLEVQKHVLNQKPTDFQAIWYDKRDPDKWWTFWAVIIIGGVTVTITLVLGGLQLVVGIFQVVYAKKQLSQQLLQNGTPGR